MVQRRNPRLTTTFNTEAEAREFARMKFDGGLILTAGTLNPQLPRKAIPSVEISVWLKSGQARNRSRASQQQRQTSLIPYCSRFCQNSHVAEVTQTSYRDVNDAELTSAPYFAT